MLLNGYVFFDLVRDIRTRVSINTLSVFVDKMSHATSPSLQSLLSLSLADQLLTGDNQYFCSRCNCLRDATKKVSFFLFFFLNFFRSLSISLSLSGSHAPRLHSPLLWNSCCFFFFISPKTCIEQSPPCLIVTFNRFAYDAKVCSCSLVLLNLWRVMTCARV